MNNHGVKIANKMAEELQNIINEAVDSGCNSPFSSMQDLVDEWDNYLTSTALNERRKKMINDLINNIARQESDIEKTRRDT